MILTLKNVLKSFLALFGFCHIFVVGTLIIVSVNVSLFSWKNLDKSARETLFLILF